jgi:hypothetical protein
MRTAKPCGSGTRCWCQVGGGFGQPNRVRQSVNSPMTVTRRIRRRGEHGISRKTIAQGRRNAPTVPVCSCALSLCTFAHETAGAASTRRSLRPQLGERFQRLGRTRAARVVESYLCTVIASEAKQSISPRKEIMDCFASLAMTGSLKIESEYLRTACCLPSAEGRQLATPFAQQKCRRSLAGICC